MVCVFFFCQEIGILFIHSQKARAILHQATKSKYLPTIGQLSGIVHDYCNIENKTLRDRISPD